MVFVFAAGKTDVRRRSIGFRGAMQLHHTIGWHYATESDRAIGFDRAIERVRRSRVAAIRT